MIPVPQPGFQGIPKWAVLCVCAVPWVAALFLVGYVASLRYPMSGVFRTSADMTGTSAFVYPFLPAERTTSPGKQPDGWTGQRVIDDPVYMNVRVPGSYEAVEATIEFRSLRQPLLELGAIWDTEGRDMEMRPLFSQALDTLPWTPVVSPGGRAGFVAPGVSPDRLDASDAARMATWLATTTMPALADAKAGGMETFDVSLRGSHDIWAVPAAGSVVFRFSVQDVNRNRSGGIVSVQVSRDGSVLWQDAVGTSGSRDEGYGATIPVNVRITDLAPGPVRIRLVADDDVYIRTISTSNPRWVIGPRFVIGDVVGYATATRAMQAWTTARHLVAETFHREGLQTLSFGPVRGDVREVRTSVRMDRSDAESAPVPFVSPKRDVRIVADGFFAMRKDGFFEPQPRRFAPETDLAAEGFAAVRTDYVRTTDAGDGWRRATVRFSMPPSVSVMRFVLSAPGILWRTGAVDVRKVDVAFTRPPLTAADLLPMLKRDLSRRWRDL